jgi:hypothetical protein
MFPPSHTLDNGPGIGHNQFHGAVVGPVKASVAQLDRASVFGTEGWGFESLQARSMCMINPVQGIFA